MTLLWFSRARLTSGASVSALIPLLTSRDTALSGHALVWSLFADGPERKRDFLWRESADRTFYMLSARPPADRHALFDLDEPKPFAPQLSSGDRLRFSLRANPVVRRETETLRVSGKHKRTKKIDVVMKALHGMPKSERAEQRKAIVREAGTAWLAQQGTRCGFEIDKDAIGVDGYETRVVYRRSGKPIQFSTLDFEGNLTVTDPDLFLASLAEGFGSAKAFGCGLMLIRRD